MLNPVGGERAGVGHYVSFLVRHVLLHDKKNTYVLFFDERFPRAEAESIAKSGTHVETVFFPLGRYKKFLPVAYSHFLVAAVMGQQRLDVIHIPGGAMPVGLHIPTVVTVHDLAIYAHPEWFPKQDLSTKVTYPRTLRVADHLLAVSETTKKDVVERFHISPRRVTTVYPGVDRAGDDGASHAVVTRKLHLRKPYVLFLGTLEPRKNVRTIIEGFVLAWKKDRTVQEMELLLAGAPGWADGGALAAVKKAAVQTKGAVRLLGYVSREEKRVLLESARVFVFPSFAEGFGLPIIEALAFGIPTIISDIPVFHEVAARAALFFDPKKPAAFEKVLIRLVSDGALQQRLAKAGKKRALFFDWKKTARQTLAIYRRVGKKKR
jgi:glycosyltransferase involved in cell wall biosynthesis